MKQENKTKSVKKFSIKMLLAMVFGGVLGGFFGVFMYYFHGDLEAFLTTWTKMVQSILVPGLLMRKQILSAIRRKNMEPFCSVSMLFHRYSAFFFLQMDTR